MWLTWLLNSSILDGVTMDHHAMLDRGVDGLVADAGVRGGVAVAPLCCCHPISLFCSNFFVTCSLRYVFPMSLMLNPFFLMAFNTADVPWGILLKSE